MRPVRQGLAGRHVERITVLRPVPNGFYLEGDTIVSASGGARREVVKVGGIGSLPDPSRLPSNKAHTRADVPELICTTVPPAEPAG